MYQNELQAWVNEGASCSSACVFILGSSVRRMPSLGAEIMIHRPYSDSTDISFAQAKSNFAKIERIAVSQFKRVGVSADLWDTMMRIPPHMARRLSLEEWFKYGLIGDDPAYADAEDSRMARHIGITKEEYLRRKALYDECVGIEFEIHRFDSFFELVEYCQRHSGRVH
jgi:hypothetical protein